jgi:hypothetical protein
MLGVNPEGKTPQGGDRHKCEDNINMDVKEIGCEEVVWMEARCRLL